MSINPGASPDAAKAPRASSMAGIAAGSLRVTPIQLETSMPARIDTTIDATPAVTAPPARFNLAGHLIQCNVVRSARKAR